jgi:hypothetical protein
VRGVRELNDALRRRQAPRLLTVVSDSPGLAQRGVQPDFLALLGHARRSSRCPSCILLDYPRIMQLAAPAAGPGGRARSIRRPMWGTPILGIIA